MRNWLAKVLTRSLALLNPYKNAFVTKGANNSQVKVIVFSWERSTIRHLGVSVFNTFASPLTLQGKLA